MELRICTCILMPAIILAMVAQIPMNVLHVWPELPYLTKGAPRQIQRNMFYIMNLSVIVLSYRILLLVGVNMRIILKYRLGSINIDFIIPDFVEY